MQRERRSGSGLPLIEQWLLNQADIRRGGRRKLPPTAPRDLFILRIMSLILFPSDHFQALQPIWRRSARS